MTKVLHTLLLLALTLHGRMQAQPFVRLIDAIPVNANGAQVKLPFAGGVNSPKHQFTDIDADGDLDLFVFDADLVIDFYRNEGDRFVPDFRLRPGLLVFPGFEVWFRLVDFDGDGKLDLVSEDSTFSGVRIFKNIGTAQAPVFALHIASLRDAGNNPVYGGQISIPAFSDIDNDGDQDFFSSNIDGTVNLYRNIGSAVNPSYEFVTGRWQNIVLFADSCSTTGPPLDAHGASAFFFADVDADADQDFFVGDLFHNGIFSIRNNGSPSLPQMECWTSYFPPNVPYTTSGFNHVSFVDIDGDNDLDLFVGVLAPLVRYDSFQFLRNTGTPTSPLFETVTKNFISTIDVGEMARPAFVDIDADGDQDMFMGSLHGQLFFFRNDGTATGPSLVLVDSSYQISGGFTYAPAFVDIDNDGDRDLFVGLFDGKIDFYRNTGTSQSAVFVHETSPVDAINVASNAVPAFADIDADGDFDLFIGRGNGRISFYRNQGSASNFLPVLEAASYQDILVGENSSPKFADIDGDTDLDLFVGARDGRIRYYQNTGSPANAQYLLVTDHFGNTTPMLEAAPSLVDIDNDGDLDLFVGTSKGGVHYYRNDMLTHAAGTMNPPDSPLLMQNYPNPFNPSTSFGFHLAHFGPVSLHVHDLLGRELATLLNGSLSAGTYTVTWRAPVWLSSGVYFYTLTTPTYSSTKKMVLMR